MLITNSKFGLAFVRPDPGPTTASDPRVPPGGRVLLNFPSTAGCHGGGSASGTGGVYFTPGNGAFI